MQSTTRSTLKRTLSFTIACAVTFSVSAQNHSALTPSPTLSKEVSPIERRATNINEHPAETAISVQNSVDLVNHVLSNLRSPGFDKEYQSLNNTYWLMTKTADAQYPTLAQLSWPLGQDPSLQPSRHPNVWPLRTRRFRADHRVDPYLVFLFAHSKIVQHPTRDGQYKPVAEFQRGVRRGLPSPRIARLRAALNDARANGVGVDGMLCDLRHAMTSKNFEYIPARLQEAFWGGISFDAALGLLRYLEVLQGSVSRPLDDFAGLMSELYPIKGVPASGQLGDLFKAWATMFTRQVMQDVADHVRQGPRAPFWRENRNLTAAAAR